MSPPTISPNSLFSAQASSVRSPGWVELANVDVCISKMPPTLRGRNKTPRRLDLLRPARYRVVRAMLFLESGRPVIEFFAYVRYSTLGRHPFFCQWCGARFYEEIPILPEFFCLAWQACHSWPFDLWQGYNKCYGGRQRVRSGFPPPSLPPASELR